MTTTGEIGPKRRLGMSIGTRGPEGFRECVSGTAQGRAPVIFLFFTGDTQENYPNAALSPSAQKLLAVCGRRPYRIRTPRRPQA
jgi:hypothetical protein